MKEFKKIISAMFVFVFVVGLCSGSVVKVQAADKTNDLPDGWVSIGLDELSKEQQEDIKNSIQLRGPAPALTYLEIIDLAVDDYNEIHVVTKEIGTAHGSYVWINGNSLCKENDNARQPLWGADNIAYGFIRYFHTGIYYSSALSGTAISVTASSDNGVGQAYRLTATAEYVFQ